MTMLAERPSKRLGMHTRLLRATARNAAYGDDSELLELAAIADYADLCRDYAAVCQREMGKTYEQLGEAFGFTKQAAHKRWGNLDKADLEAKLGIR